MNVRIAVLCTVLVAGCGDDGQSSADAAVGVDASAPDAAPGVDATPGSDAEPGSDASPGADATPGPGTLAGCGPLTVEAGASIGGYLSDRYAWSDRACQARSAALVRNDGPDPGGTHGGYLRELTYVADGSTRTVVGQDGGSWRGWGYVVNHYASTAATSASVEGAWRPVFAGPHHAVHEFTLQVHPGGPVDVTIHWVFATGRSHPLLAITHDTSGAGPDEVDADARGPYGNLAFDEVDGDVAGLGWGDTHRFVTTSGPVSFASSWDYAEPNLIPHVMMWTDDPDAEMGVVQTQSWDDQIAGGDYGGGMLADCQGRTSADPGSCALQSGGTMLTDWLWPYQLNQYELPWGSTSKRMAWGHSYGAVGQSSYWAFGADRVGYPYLSYTVALVLGKHGDAPTDALIRELETVLATTVAASTGTVATTGPGGPGRTDLVPYTPAGWDPVHAAWTFHADASAVAATFDVPAPGLPNPVLRVRGWTGGAPTTVSLDGVPLLEGSGWVASIDDDADVLWLTVGATLAGNHSLSIQ